MLQNLVEGPKGCNNKVFGSDRKHSRQINY